MRHETPKYLISLGKYDEALEAIRACFHKDEDHVEILNYMKRNNHQETDKIDYLKAIFDKSYQRTLVILLVNVTFLTINGPQTLTFFGQLLLNDIYKRGPPSAHMDVALGLNLNLVAETLGLILSIYIIGRMFKKKMMLTYALGLCVLNLSVAFLIQVDNKPLIQLGMMLLFIIQWGFGLGAMTVYSIEVTNNTTFGLFYLYQFSSNFTFGMMTPAILAKVNTCLLFVLFACGNLGHMLFIQKCIKPTEGLNDMQKKTLYEK